MKKAILVSEEQYIKMIDGYDHAVRELSQARRQLQELQKKSKAVKLVEPDEGVQNFGFLDDLFELCQGFDECATCQPEPLKKVLEWFDTNKEIVPEDIGECLTRTLTGYEMQWFVNGFRFAMGIWRAC